MRDTHLPVDEGCFEGVLIHLHGFVGRQGFSGQRKPAGKEVQDLAVGSQSCVYSKVEVRRYE